MKECTKAFVRRAADINVTARYFVGDGVDIGGAPDPLTLYAQFFPRMGKVRIWDLADGDAQFMASVADDSFDFVHSSHCLEHLVDPAVGLRNWFRILKPGGHLVVIVPDEDLYEQGVFPSTYNSDHKWTFTVSKSRSWSEKSRNLIELLAPAWLGRRSAQDRMPRLDLSLRPAALRPDTDANRRGRRRVRRPQAPRRRSRARRPAAARRRPLCARRARSLARQLTYTAAEDLVLLIRQARP
jgi:SAM-dependent methyltransferase